MGGLTVDIVSLFLSTPSARRATVNVHAPDIDVNISIHALREEGDGFFIYSLIKTCLISIHALREEGDHPSTRPPRSTSRFLSTPSARRATSPYKYGTQLYEIFLSTPSARRATPANVVPPSSR